MSVLAQDSSTDAFRIEIPSSFNPVGSGARALGMGGAFIAIADDATAASWNPGGLIQLRWPEVAVVGAFVYRSEDNTFGTHPEASGQEDVSNVNLNYLSASYPCKAEVCGRNMVFSLNYQHLFDFTRQWNFPFQGQSESGSFTFNELVDYRQEGSLYALGLAYAVQATEQLALGVTVNFRNDFLADNEWTQTYRFRGTGLLEGSPPFTFQAFSEDKFSFRGVNFNLGLWWEAYQKEQTKLTIGAVLKTPFTADIRRRSELKTFSTLPGDQPFSDVETDKQKLRLPMSYGIGVAYQVSDQFTLALDISRTEWDDFELSGTGGEKRSPISNRPRAESDVHATHQLRLGAEYRLIGKQFGQDYLISLRAGLFYDPAPAEGNPDDFYGLSLGGGIAFRTVVFDLAYQYRFGKEVGQSGLEELDFSQDVQEHTVYGSMFIRF